MHLTFLALQFENNFRFCTDCWDELSGDLNSLESEVAHIRTQLAQTPEGIIIKNAKSFAIQFLPKSASGIKHVSEHGDDLYITTYNRLHYIPRLGKTSTVEIGRDRYDTWVQNLNLYKFIQNA